MMASGTWESCGYSRREAWQVIQAKGQMGLKTELEGLQSRSHLESDRMKFAFARSLSGC